MRCPNCDSENNDSAKFCKKCGTPLEKKVTSHESMINSMNEKTSSNNNTKYIIVALIIVAVVLAGAFIYLYGFGSNQSNDSQPAQVQNNTPSVSQDDEPAQAQSTQATQSTPATTSMSILGGSFSTGGGLEDKTYAMVPKTVDSSGYIDVKSADAYKYFPDYAEINLYDNSGNLLDTQSVSLNPDSGTQTF